MKIKIKPLLKKYLGTPAKLGKRDEVQGGRRAETEIVCGIQRGCEHRATPQFAHADGFAGVSLLASAHRLVSDA